MVLLTSPTQWTQWILAFALFRFFDIVKVWPASFFDKKFMHSSSIILDDLVSALHSVMVYYIIENYLLRAL